MVRPASLPPNTPSVHNAASLRDRAKQDFARLLSRLIVERNWSQADLAREADLGPDAISTYIRARSFPEPRTMLKLAKALGVEVSALYPRDSSTTMLDPETSILEIRQATTHTDKCWVHINRLVTLDQAAAIFDIVKGAGE